MIGAPLECRATGGRMSSAMTDSGLDLLTWGTGRNAYAIRIEDWISLGGREGCRMLADARFSAAFVQRENFPGI